MNKNEMLNQKKLEAKLIAERNKEKEKSRWLQNSGYVTSQWNDMTEENRLIKCDHYLKTGERAKLDFLRSELKRQKALNKKDKVIRIDNT